MACCYGMECDILGLLPRHLFQRLLTMHNTWNNQYNQYNPYNSNNYNINTQYDQYKNAIQIAKNYHTLSTVPHHYNEDIDINDNDVVELSAGKNIDSHDDDNGNGNGNGNNQSSNKSRICGMCDHKMDYLSDDTSTLECGHEFHELCINAWPINLNCPLCLKEDNQVNINNNNNNNTDGDDIIVDDSDDQLDYQGCDTAQSRLISTNIQLL